MAAGPAGLPEASFLVVEEGVVLLASCEGGARRRMLVTIAAPGSVLVALGRRQELRALTRARVAAVTPEAERELLLEPAAAAAITSALVGAVCDREESIANVAGFPHAERVRGKLLQLARSHGKVKEDGVLIDLPLTHDLIAESVGSTRETATLALRGLKQEGFASRPGGRYRLNLPPEEVAAGGRGSG